MTLLLILLLALQPAAVNEWLITANHAKVSRLPAAVTLDERHTPAAQSTIRDVRQGRTGVISHMGAGYPADYLALPIGPGHRVRICGPKACLVVVSTDAGPSSAMLREGRIADVSVELFRRLCCDESRGLFRGSWSLTIPIPDTSTED